MCVCLCVCGGWLVGWLVVSETNMFFGAVKTAQYR